MLVVWAICDSGNSQLSAASAGTALGCTGPMLYLSHLEHRRSFRPSTVLAVYLLLQTLLSLTQTCTLWTFSGVITVQVFMTIITVVNCLLLTLESWEKPRRLYNEKECRPEKFSGIANRAVIFWLNRLLLIGARGPVTLDQLYGLNDDMSSGRLYGVFSGEYQKRQKTSGYPSICTLAMILRWPLLITTLPRLLMLALTVCQPLLTERLLKYLGSDPDSAVSQPDQGRGLIGAYALLYIGLAVSTSLYWQLHYRVITMIRGCLVSALNAKLVRLDPTAVSDPQASISLMSTDIQQITLGLNGFHDLWAYTVQVCIAAYLLERQVGAACVASIILAVCCALASMGLSPLSKSRQKRWMEAVESRISITSSLLSSIKGIKMRGLLSPAADRIQHLRNIELKFARRFRHTIVWSLVLAFIPNFISPIITFLVFVLQARAEGEVFDAVRAFTALSILIILCQPLTSTLQTVPMLAAAIGSFGRIDAFLCAPEHVDIRDFPLDVEQSSTAPGKSDPAGLGCPIEMEPQVRTGQTDNVTHEKPIVFCTVKATLGWSKKHDVLRDTTISVPKGLLTCIVGPVASGKTTLCRALIGEGTCREGKVYTYASADDVAYCGQTPWLINNSIRRNILGYSDFDPDWYNITLEACALQQDLKEMLCGDQTMVGNEGAALSGGQKQRVALARAIYSRKSILVLDGIMSGLDAHTAHHVFHHAIGPEGIVRTYGATVVYASHAYAHLAQADHIIALKGDGQIRGTGRYQDLGLDLDETSSDTEQTFHPSKESETKENFTERVTLASMRPNLVDVDRSQSDSAVHVYYFKTAGSWVLIVLFAFTAVATGLFVASTYWLQFWTSRADSNSIYYWGIYCVMQCLGLISLAAAGYQTLIVLITRTGSALHKNLLQTLSHARWTFLGGADSGKILNHFSQDIELVDRDLPFGFINTLLNLFTAVGQSALIVALFPWSAIAVGCCLLVLYVLQKFYLRTSRQLRLLDLEAKSPLYSNYAETLNGLDTLRTYGWLGNNFDVAQTLLNRSQQPAYLLLIAQQWLNFVLDIIVACIAVIVVSIAVLEKSHQGTTGVAMTQIMNIGTMMQSALKSWTLFEISIGAISRIKTFAESTPSEATTNRVEPKIEWPSCGRVELKDVTAALQDGTAALKKISMTIRPGEKVGICGKSGSGKSSLILALLQLLELKEGRIAIDGLHLDEIHQDTVRTRINTIPQDPTSMPGTVRQNLDPYNVYSDDKLIATLERTKLAHLIDSKLALSSNFQSSALSSGERQLFALAMAILRKSKLVLVDEASSQVDNETEAQIMQIVRDEFRSSTVLAVAHRLESLLDYDRIVVMGDGAILETDSPKVLLSRDSHFSRLLHRLRDRQSVSG
ncbi:P-loop containing nucleoside triphosphate hydrolase protein [Polychaeton citri CBS 116435]|uniref:P-loop containing nucleoside triphosphate hydrolase protein n=1 Tax=Polychaeton citri CBS 116435 TaxID=1314669 RepID=A0A9P4Q5L8_9PEZI|nr:P-loop containing nucleoside triphosphate hydrolase protein [Polychaeton citri CBS 116435]